MIKLRPLDERLGANKDKVLERLEAAVELGFWHCFDYFTTDREEWRDNATNELATFIKELKEQGVL